MTFHFSIDKLLAAVGHVLRLNRGTLNHLNLIKILYAADKRALIDWGRPITGDFMCAMPHGPALRTLVNMTAGDAPAKLQGRWNRHFTTKGESPKGDQYEIAMTSEPNSGVLSAAEKSLLEQFNREYAKLSPFQLVRLVHGDHFPEWHHPRPKGCVPIDLKRMLRGAGKTDEEIRAVLESNQRSASLHDMLRHA